MFKLLEEEKFDASNFCSESKSFLSLIVLSASCGDKIRCIEFLLCATCELNTGPWNTLYMLLLIKIFTFWNYVFFGKTCFSKNTFLFSPFAFSHSQWMIEPSLRCQNDENMKGVFMCNNNIWNWTPSISVFRFWLISYFVSYIMRAFSEEIFS